MEKRIGMIVLSTIFIFTLMVAPASAFLFDGLFGGGKTTTSTPVPTTADKSQLELLNKTNTPGANSYRLMDGQYHTLSLSEETARNLIRNQIRNQYNISETENYNISVYGYKDDQNREKYMYQIQNRYRGKLFGVFTKELIITGLIDADTGDIIEVDAPWYYKLVTDLE